MDGDGWLDVSKELGDRLLHGLSWATAVAAATGVLISVPPFTLFIFPVYEQVHMIHGWVSLVIGVPFFAAVFAHGVPAWRVRGFSFLTRTGLLLSIAFFAALASGAHARFAPEKLPWVLVVHFGGGILTAVFIFLHVRRWSGPRRTTSGEDGKAGKRL